jgi:HK97 family phage portal protein
MVKFPKLFHRRTKDKGDIALNDIDIVDIAKKSKSKAKAKDPAFSSWYLGDLDHASLYRSGRLSFKELEEIYFQSSIVRAIVDGITRVISSLDWKIVSLSAEKEMSPKRLHFINSFFQKPNANDESFSTIIRKLVRDLLIYDASVIEKVKSKAHSLSEIYARDGSTFEIRIDEHGIVKGYTQRVYTPSEQSVTFDPDEIIYMSLYPRTSSPYGTPPLDALVNEIAAVMFATRLVAKSFELDEIPPGILNLGKIGQVAYDRAREYFKERRESGRKNYELTIVHDTDKVEWIPLTRMPQELQLSELIDKVNRMIFRCFGVTPTEMGAIEDINRATAQVQENIGKSKLILPIVRMLEEYINSEIIWLHIDNEVKIVFTKPSEDDPKLTLEICDRLVSRGVLTINEARKRLGEKAIAGGDKSFILNGSQVIMLDQLNQYAMHPESLTKKIYKSDNNTDSDFDLITIDTNRIYQIKDDFYQELSDEWGKTGNWLLKELTKAYFADGKYKNILERAKSQLFGRMRNLLEKNIRDAYIAAEEVASKDITGITKSQQQNNNDFEKRKREAEDKMKKILFIIIDGWFLKALAKFADMVRNDKTQETSQVIFTTLKDSFFKAAYKLKKISAMTIDFFYKKYFSKIKKFRPALKEYIYWITTSGNPCPSCKALQSGSPYTSETLKYEPGCEKLICDGACKCLLVYKLIKKGERIPDPWEVFHEINKDKF